MAHYRRAWEHAQHALDLLDAETTPAVSFTQSTDPLRNGTANVTVTGTVFDVRPARLEAVTIAVGNRTRTVPVRTNRTSGTAGSFVATVRVEAPVATVTATVVDPGEPVSDLTDLPPSSTAARSFDLDDGDANVTLQVTVAAGIPGDGNAKIVAEAGGRSRTVFDLDADERGPTTVTANLSAFAGEQVTITLLTTGDARLTVERLRLQVDGDRDGLTDGQEVKWVVQVDGDSKLDHTRRSPLSADTDPADPDTADDALDGAERDVLGFPIRTGRGNRTPPFMSPHPLPPTP